ncbi:MAG: hypothetical protein D6820_07380, partial [Lentisphaerae bacterium]
DETEIDVTPPKLEPLLTIRRSKALVEIFREFMALHSKFSGNEPFVTRRIFFRDLEGIYLMRPMTFCSFKRFPSMQQSTITLMVLLIMGNLLYCPDQSLLPQAVILFVFWLLYVGGVFINHWYKRKYRWHVIPFSHVQILAIPIHMRDTEVRQLSQKISELMQTHHDTALDSSRQETRGEAAAVQKQDLVV